MSHSTYTPPSVGTSDLVSGSARVCTDGAIVLRGARLPPVLHHRWAVLPGDESVLLSVSHSP